MAKTSFFQGVNWGPVPTGTDPMRGSILRIRADMRSRLADRNHQRLDGGGFGQGCFNMCLIY
jgi:hypothetical protein